MRHTKGHTGNRRSHHALEEARFSKCPSCGAEHVRHQVCTSCGMYRGRVVIDVKGVKDRQIRRKQAKLKSLGQPTSKAKSEADAKE